MSQTLPMRYSIHQRMRKIHKHICFIQLELYPLRYCLANFDSQLNIIQFDIIFGIGNFHLAVLCLVHRATNFLTTWPRGRKHIYTYARACAPTKWIIIQVLDHFHFMRWHTNIQYVQNWAKLFFDICHLIWNVLWRVVLTLCTCLYSTWLL